MFGRIAAYTAIAALLSITAAIANEVERPVPHKAEAKETEKHPTEQQNRMKTCNVEAGKKELKGDERKAFMSACLRTH
ncbi:MAG: PsiF family protein [Usitatibacter sp.]